MYGTIIDIQIPKTEGVSRDCAFVWYMNAKDVDFLLKLQPEVLVEGRKVTLTRARRQGSPRPPRAKEKGKALEAPQKLK